MVCAVVRSLGELLLWAPSPACAAEAELPGRLLRSLSSQLSAGTGGIKETSGCVGSCSELWSSFLHTLFLWVRVSVWLKALWTKEVNFAHN